MTKDAIIQQLTDEYRQLSFQLGQLAIQRRDLERQAEDVERLMLARNAALEAVRAVDETGQNDGQKAAEAAVKEPS